MAASETNVRLVVHVAPVTLVITNLSIGWSGVRTRSSSFKRLPPAPDANVPAAGSQTGHLESGVMPVVPLKSSAVSVRSTR